MVGRVSWDETRRLTPRPWRPKRTGVVVDFPLTVFLLALQAAISYLGWWVVLFSAMGVGSCASRMRRPCNYELGTIADYLYIGVAIVAFLGAIAGVAGLRIRRQLSVWVPTVGIALVIVAAAVSLLLRAIAFD